MPLVESVSDDTVRDHARPAAGDGVFADSKPICRIDAGGQASRSALLRLAEEVRRRRKGAGAIDAHECTIVALTALSLDGRRRGKSFLARVLYVSPTGLAVLLDRPAPATAFVVEWDDAAPMIFDLTLSRRMRGRYEAALVLREAPPASPPAPSENQT